MENTPSTPPVESDEALLARIAEGDTEAFGAFYDRHSSALLGIAYRILEQNEEAEDALQEALTLLWERSSSYTASLGRPLSWAVALTRNKAIDRLRGRQRRLAWVSTTDGELPELPTDQRPIEPFIHDLDQQRLLRIALNELPTDQRRAIELAFFSGLTHAEVAKAVAAPLGTVKARIRRGMLALRDGLEGEL